ncbi:hypothetical protein [Singulisphaera sp. GP187]|uniref:hypothetical protein n=1 Tax=Singulisphaera sp. GP187 TaxID=1882752 RepID=UPI0011611F7D|nr:hypothetical protein [Singulisphaera sp. GP187]
MPTTSTLTPRRRPGKFSGPYSQREALEVARRNILIVRYAADGEPVANLSTLTGLTPRQIRRILGAAPETQATKQTVSAGEYRELSRECSHDPEKLEWLASVRVDARRNGQPISNWSPNRG